MPSSPSFGLGLAALGRPGYINLGHAADLSAGHDPDAMRANAHAVLDAAYDAGVRYFDAARSYGRAEEFLADWLRRRNLLPDQVFVASKWGYTYTADWRDRRRQARGQGPLGRHVPPTARGEPGHPRAVPAPVPDPLGDARERRSGRCGGSGRIANVARVRHPDRSVGDRTATGGHDAKGAEPRTCSTRCRRRGTCWSDPLATAWPRRRRRGFASSSRSRWPTAG